ncbi:hypothetical protein [Spartinivicinus ruber]|uniref:hypothetical protein n=1 Tax=Spartinivicinus ruber TaxID=2683272 RepID=UPI0013D65B49|nr:hypothetical protein [Spartinivicinus ruber]
MAKPYFTKQNPNQPIASDKPHQGLLAESKQHDNMLSHTNTLKSIERNDIPTLNDIADSSLNNSTLKKAQQLTNGHVIKKKQPNKSTTDIPTLTTPAVKSATKKQRAEQLVPSKAAQYKINVNNPFIPESVKAKQEQPQSQQVVYKADKPTSSQPIPSTHTSDNSSSELSSKNLRRAKCLDEGVRNKLRQELEMQSEIVLQEVIDEFIPQIEAEFHKRIRSEINAIIDHIVNH